MNDKDVSSGLLERARKCKTPEEMRAIVQESGQPLSDDLLEELSGGCSNVGTVNTRCMLVYRFTVAPVLSDRVFPLLATWAFLGCPRKCVRFCMTQFGNLLI